MRVTHIVAVFLGLLAVSAGAQNIYVYPAAPVAPAGTSQSITSEITGQNDKTVTWTTTGGTLQGTNPCVVNEPCTIALYTLTPGTYTVTATSNANHSLTATSTVTITASPTPITTNPKFGGVSSTNLAALQAKAVSGNTLYQNGLHAQAVYDLTNSSNGMNLYWNWSCGGGVSNTKTGLPIIDQSVESDEQYAYVFAFMQLVNPYPTAQTTYNWGCYSHDLYMYLFNVWLNPLNNGLYNADSYGQRYDFASFSLSGDYPSDQIYGLTMGPDWLLGSSSVGAGSGATLSSSGMSLTGPAVFTGTATLYSTTLTGVSVTSGTPAVGMIAICTGGPNIPNYVTITSISGSTYTVSDEAQSGSGTVNCTAYGISASPTVSAGGSGYYANEALYWYAKYDATSKCAVQSYYNDIYTVGYGSPSGDAVVMSGTAQVNSSGVVTSATVTTPPYNCSSPPTSFVIPNDAQTLHNFLAQMGASNISIRASGGPGTGAIGPVCGSTGAPCTSYDSSQIFDTGSGYDYTTQRAMGNNYTHTKLLAFLAAAYTLADNTTVDPPLTNTCSATRYQVCPDGSAGSLHAYGPYLMGSMLAKDYAHTEDPNVTQAAFNNAFPSGGFGTQQTCLDSATTTGSNIRVSCFGDGRDGESSEGNWYQYSMYRTAMFDTSLVSAGMDDPTIYGPQIGQAFSSWWDLKANSDLAELAVNTAGGYDQFSVAGDTLYLYRLYTDFNAEAWLMVEDSLLGRTDRTSKLLWPNIFAQNSATFYSSLINGDGNLNAIPLFIALPSGDPTVSPPSDPRLSLPTDTYSGNNGHIHVVSNWVANGPTLGQSQTFLDVICNNTRIDHEHTECPSFDVFSNGEFITLRMTIFNNYDPMKTAAPNANILGAGTNPSQSLCTVIGGCEWAQGIQGQTGYNGGFYTYQQQTVDFGVGSGYWQCNNASNCTDAPPASDWTDTGLTSVVGGGQFWHGNQAGNAYMNHAEMPNYVAFDVDTTLLYVGSNSPLIGYGSLSGPTAVSRSLIYQRANNRVIYEDREAGAYFTSDYLNTTGAITITGNTASWLTQSSNQKAYLTMLLPTSGTTLQNGGSYLTLNNGGSSCCGTDTQPYATIRENAGSPATAQFLNVLEWGASGFTKSTTTLAQSSSGQGYDCAVVAGTLNCFMRSWYQGATFSGTTIPASSATTVYVADLAPNTTYTVSGTGAPANCTSDNSGTCTFSATGTGSITVGAFTPPAITAVQGVSLLGVGVQ